MARRTNLEKVEWLCRCGLYDYLPQLKEEVEYIADNVDPDGSCHVETYDSEFRALLILHCAGIAG